MRLFVCVCVFGYLFVDCKRRNDYSQKATRCCQIKDMKPTEDKS